MGCGAKELGIFGDAAGVWRFLVAFRKALWNFPRQDHGLWRLGISRLSGYEIRNFKVAKSSGEGRGNTVFSARDMLRQSAYINFQLPINWCAHAQQSQLAMRQTASCVTVRSANLHADRQSTRKRSAHQTPERPAGIRPWGTANLQICHTLAGNDSHEAAWFLPPPTPCFGSCWTYLEGVEK